MRMRWVRFVLALVLTSSVAVVPRAVRTQVMPLRIDEGAVGLGLALRQLAVEGSVLYVTAHPDDENNGVLVALGRGRGLKTSLLTLTRGDGGQNEIGPELFQAIGILRAEELAGVHLWDGADQYFTRANEFGYSFSVDETFEKWGRDEILRDVVRVVRTVRPDVMLTMNRDSGGGGQHHMASARLAHEAFRAAADPARFPEQIAEGLRPWQARKVYQAGGFGGGPGPANAVQVRTGDFDSLLGMSWAQAGQLARAYHRCQGMAQLEAFPGEAGGSFALYDAAPAVTGREADIMDGVDTSLRRLAQLAGPEASRVPSLAADLAAVEAAAHESLDAFDARAPHKTLPPLSRGLTRVRELRRVVQASGLSVGPKAEIGWRLDRKARDFEKALRLAQGLVVHVLAADGNVVRGQTFDVAVQVYNTGPEPMSLDGVDLHVPPGWAARLAGGTPGPLESNQSASLVYNVTVGAGARYTQPYWKVEPGIDRYAIEMPEHHTLPWSPADVTATVRYTAAGVPATYDAPAYYRYDGPWVGGEKQKIVNVVPDLSVRLTPDVGVVPLAAGGRPREFRVTVLNNSARGGAANVRLEAPAGWLAAPASATLSFSLEEEEMTARFMVTPPARLAPGAVEIRAVASRDGVDYREGYQVIAYDHIQTRHLYHPAVSTVKLFDVTVPANLQVGYVMGTGDEVPDAIRQLGAGLTMLTPDEIAFGDLSRFSTIVLGIRAYESRSDVRAYHQRLLDFARNGGHLVVQYNKVAMNQLGAGAAGGGGRGFVAQAAGQAAAGGGRGGFGGGGRGRGGAAPSSPYVPFPGAVTSNRVSVEEAPIRVLQGDTDELAFPNRITQTDFQDWVQERGLYFFGANSAEYTDLLAATDPWPNNPGEKTGMLTVARLGKGTWTYVGLGLWRQLPAGVPGAYRIMANLISRPRVP